MNEFDFYRKKIFEKESINVLRKTEGYHESWYKSDNYDRIMRFKRKLESKLKKEQQVISSQELYDRIINLLGGSELKCQCAYCGLKEEDLNKLNDPNPSTNRYPQRGKFHELERKQPDRAYTDLDNLVVACYWCNNAKTDTFTVQEFIPIAEKIGEVWKTRLS